MAEHNYQLIAHTDKKSPVSEAFRTIRTNIQFSQAGQELKVIMLTSPTQNEGKTTVIANLGVVMAQAGYKVLVVDADLRNPSQHKVFKLQNVGVSNVISTGTPVADCIKATEVDNLWVLPAGPVAPNPSELLGSKIAYDLIVSLKPYYDFILIDTPPILPVTDAVIVSGKVDGTIMLIDSGVIGVEAAKEAKDRLDKAHGHILGVVLNKVDIHGGKYGYGKGYGYGYGYYSYYGADEKEK